MSRKATYTFANSLSYQHQVCVLYGTFVLTKKKTKLQLVKEICDKLSCVYFRVARKVKRMCPPRLNSKLHTSGPNNHIKDLPPVQASQTSTKRDLNPR